MQNKEKEEINEEVIKTAATIARLYLEENEIKRLKEELQTILNYFSIIKDLEYEGELYYVHDYSNEFRADNTRENRKRIKEEKKEDIADEIVSQFTQKENRNLIAPKSLKQ